MIKVTELVPKLATSNTPSLLKLIGNVASLLDRALAMESDLESVSDMIEGSDKEEQLDCVESRISDEEEACITGG